MFRLIVICEHVIQVHALNVNFKGFCWQCSSAVGLSSILDFVHCFRLFISRDEICPCIQVEVEIRDPTLLGPVIETLFSTGI